MRKILFILFILFSFNASAQTFADTTALKAFVNDSIPWNYFTHDRTRQIKKALLGSVNFMGSGAPTLQQVLDAGSTLTSSETITTSTNQLEVSGSKSGTTTSDGVFRVINSGSGVLGIYAEANTGISSAVYGSATSGIAIRGNGRWGVYGESSVTASLFGSATSSANGLLVQSVDGETIVGLREPASTNTTISMMRLQRGSTGTAANNIAGSIDMEVEADNGTFPVTSKLISKLPIAANASATSQFLITGLSNAVTDTMMSLGGYVSLTESSATTFARTTLATGKINGGSIVVTIEANDATDYQSRTLRFIWSAVNKAGTTTITISTPEEVVAVSTGTLTATITAVDAGGGVIDFKADAVSSLTQSTLRATYQIFKNF